MGVLFGDKAPTAKFEKLGDKIVWHKIISVDVQQQRDYNTDELKVWPDTGKPMEQIRLIVATKGENGEEQNVAIYVKGRMKKALQDAVRRSGAVDLEPGSNSGSIVYVADGEVWFNKAGKKMHPAKEYEATYTVADPVKALEDAAPPF
jgi:hypothetical protein